MPNTKQISISLSWVSFTSKNEFIKQSQRICPDSHTRKNPTLWLPHIDASMEIRINYDDLQAPSRWKKPKIVFFNPNVDLFHSAIPAYVVHGVFQTMASNPQHTFFLSTVFTERMAGMSGVLPWKPNIWMGVRITDEEISVNLNNLRECGALNRYLALETVFCPLQHDWLENVDWVLSGIDSGGNPRKTPKELVSWLKNTCLDKKIAFYHKTWRKIKGSAKALHHGVNYEALPPTLLTVQKVKHQREVNTQLRFSF